MKITFWQRLLKALELYCLLRTKDLESETGGKIAVPGSSVLDIDIVAEQLELDFPGVVYIKNSLNAQEFAKRYEVIDKVSLTVPDQTLSIREIMKRFASGLPIDGEKVPIYDGEEDDMPDLSKMDLAERQEYIELAKSELSDLNVKLEEDRRKKAVKPKKEDIPPAEGNSPVPHLQFPEQSKEPKDPAPPIS